MKLQNTQPATFQDQTVPAGTRLAGAAALVYEFGVAAPLRRPRCVTEQRVRDNLLGAGRYCPIIRRTETLERYLALDLATRARDTVGRTGGHLVARAASFLLLADSRASFQIEGERPPRNRLERWGRAVLQAGKNKLTLDEIIRLHGVLIEDTRFVRAGLRPDGVFLAGRDHLGDPLPEFIGAPPPDPPHP